MSTDAEPAGPPNRRGWLIGDWRFVTLMVLGLALFGGSIFLRLADQTQDFAPVTEDELGSDTFSVGIDPGTHTGLVASESPSLRLTTGVDPGTVDVKFRVLFANRHGDTGTGKIAIHAPEANDTDFYLNDPHNAWSRQELSVVQMYRLDGQPPSADVEVSFTGPGFHVIEVGWIWRPSVNLRRSGIGRHNLRVVFNFQQKVSVGLSQNSTGIETRPLTTDPLVVGDSKDALDESMRHLVLSYAAGPNERVISAGADGIRPAPNIIQWNHEDHPIPSYYLLTIEDQHIRFWVGLLNEQILFFAGILLGAAAGTFAANWYTTRPAADGKVRPTVGLRSPNP